MKLLLATRLISAVLAAVIGTTAVGGGLTWAASDSLPGEVLYPVKLTGEDLRLSLASRPESQVELTLQFADERVAEIELLVEHGSPVPETVVARLERQVFRAMNQAAWASEEEIPGLLKRIAQRTQVQAQTLEQLQLRASAQVQNQAQLQNAHRICRRAQEEAMAGLDDPQTFRARYQHRDSMPEDVTPPEPPTRQPQEGEGRGPGPQGPDEPDENHMDRPSDGPSGDRDQDRDRDQEHDPQQDQDRDRQQDREGSQQQDRDRDRDQDREDDPQQDQDRDQQQDQQGDSHQDDGRSQQQDQQPQQDRDQQQDQQPDQERDQQQDPQRDGEPGGSNDSSGRGS